MRRQNHYNKYSQRNALTREFLGAWRRIETVLSQYFWAVVEKIMFVILLQLLCHFGESLHVNGAEENGLDSRVRWPIDHVVNNIHDKSSFCYGQWSCHGSMAIKRIYNNYALHTGSTWVGLQWLHAWLYSSLAIVRFINLLQLDKALFL